MNENKKEVTESKIVVIDGVEYISVKDLKTLGLVNSVGTERVESVKDGMFVSHGKRLLVHIDLITGERISLEANREQIDKIFEARDYIEDL